MNFYRYWVIILFVTYCMSVAGTKFDAIMGFDLHVYFVPAFSFSRKA